RGSASMKAPKGLFRGGSPMFDARRTLSALVLAGSLGTFALLPADARATPPEEPVLEVVATFDASMLETPESIAFDSRGNTFVSLGLTGEIRKIEQDGTQSTHAFLPIGAPLTPCG